MSAPEPGRALLPETFIHIPGIGHKTELRLWQAGVTCWDDLLETRLSDRPGIQAAIERSREALEGREIEFFFSTLPPPERWRTFADFDQRFLALDIETTGMSIYDQVTVIGTEIDGAYRAFVRGANLDEAAELIRDAEGLITFNGSTFDLPFIPRTFPDLELPIPHVDLRFLGRRVGLSGSLKVVEELAQLERDMELDDISGYEATVLWSEFDYGGEVGSLERLITYNAADTCVLRPLASLIVNHLAQRLDAMRTAEDGRQSLFESPRWSSPRPSKPQAPPPLPRITAAGTKLHIGKQTLPVPEHRGLEPEMTLSALRARMRDPNSRIVGIDLTGSAKRPTGWALLGGDHVVTGVLNSTEEIIERTLGCEPALVSIDSPLSLPVGRHCTDDECSCRDVGGIMRECERELKRRGVNVYPCLIRSMQALTRRGIEVAQALRAAGVPAIESYPGAAQDIMRIPRKRASQAQLRAGLERFGVHGIREPDALTHDELDAVTSAVVGAFYLAEFYEALGTEAEDFLIIPTSGPVPAAGQSRDLDSAGAVQVHYLVGPGAEGAIARVNGRGASVQALADLGGYWGALSDAGPTARAAYVGAAGERLSRRPSFFDWQGVEDDPELPEKLDEWLTVASREPT